MSLSILCPARFAVIVCMDFDEPKLNSNLDFCESVPRTKLFTGVDILMWSIKNLVNPLLPALALDPTECSSPLPCSAMQDVVSTKHRGYLSTTLQISPKEYKKRHFDVYISWLWHFETTLLFVYKQRLR